MGLEALKMIPWRLSAVGLVDLPSRDTPYRAGTENHFTRSYMPVVCGAIIGGVSGFFGTNALYRLRSISLKSTIPPRGVLTGLTLAGAIVGGLLLFGLTTLLSEKSKN